ncbi:MAG: hypothetical protein OXC91_14975 [Rhodobacteraceae bacterium]|nr:hypothetical protein [Paracoccaceae bacterium]
MALAPAGILFAIFVINVALGASAGPVFLTFVQEMVLLFMASIAFSVAILMREAASLTVDNDLDTE